MTKIIQFKRGTTAQWTSVNPILLEGEIGIELPNKLKVGNNVDHWNDLSYSDKVLTDQVGNLNNELNRLSSKINSEPDKVFTYRGNTLPTFPSIQMLGYYLTFYSLPADNLVLQFPNIDLPEGTIMSIDNNDKNDDITYKPRTGDKIDNKTDQEVILPPKSIAFLVKKDTGWQTAYSGVLADNLSVLIELIKPLLPDNAGLTIDEIQAQLKDRLHTFSEIQSEFASQLHSYVDLVANGFVKSTYDYGFQDGTSSPIGTGWKVGTAQLTEDKILGIPDLGTKNMVFTVSAIFAPLISKVIVNGTERDVTVVDYIENELHYKAFITNSPILTGGNIRVKFEFEKTSLSISDVETALQDKLHTFSEIENQFATRLHTLQELKEDGFLSQLVHFGKSDNADIPTGLGWIYSDMSISGEGTIAEFLSLPSHIVVKVPSVLDKIITNMKIDGTAAAYTPKTTKESGIDFTYYITDNKYSTNGTKVSFEFFDKNPQVIPNQRITVSNGTTDVVEVEKLTISNSLISGDKTNVQVKPLITIEETGGSYNLVESNKVSFYQPLEVTPDQADPNNAVITIHDSAFAPQVPEGYYGTIDDEFYLMPTVKFTTPDTQVGYVNFSSSIVKNPLKYISIVDSPDNSSYTITQKAFEGTHFANGTPYVIYSRIVLKGISPKDNLYVKYSLTDSADNIINGADGVPISTTRIYKKDEALWQIDLYGIVIVKDPLTFKFTIESNIGVDNAIELYGRTEGSVAMIQMVTNNYKTGTALLQLENDLGIRLLFNIYDINKVASLSNLLNEMEQGQDDIQAGKLAIKADGWSLKAITNMSISVVADDSLEIRIPQADVNKGYYSLGKIISAEKTLGLRGKQVDVTAMLRDVKTSMLIVPAVWKGSPDAYDYDIVGSVSAEIPQPSSADWFILFDQAYRIHIDYSSPTEWKPFTHVFAIPHDAVNMAYIIVPFQEQLDSQLNIKDFKIESVSPFTYAVVKRPESLIDKLATTRTNVKEVWDFVEAASASDFEGVKLSANPGGTQLVLMKASEGNEDIIFIRNSQYPKGIVKFASAGTVRMFADYRGQDFDLSSSDQAASEFWWSTYDETQQTYTTIQDSVFTHTITTENPNWENFQGKSFTFDVTAGTMIAPFGKGGLGNTYAIGSSSEKDYPLHAFINFVASSKPSSDEPIAALYTEDQLGNVWEVTTETDGHIDTKLVGDLPENTKHHVIRDNLNLNDFDISNDGIISLKTSIDTLNTQIQNLTDEINALKAIISITDIAKTNGAYIEVDYSDVTGQPDLNLKLRT